MENTTVATERKMLTANDVADKLGISVSLGYRIIKTLNYEMEKAGYLTIHGRVDEQYFIKRYFTA